ncbi:5-methyltetrahydropteroyltriglutamate--homocysteine S-methyltransferase [Tenacibaculum maritimum]|uniref:5-methyltetrahydropteroyltriglutamate--homocysteine methyltransferase n=1 Tax=Tenacibaculum maritimum NCIMB 2154 TaxID=1349785 RepID=A0A2H1EC30_9FLAO|nr:5-methyltetrahydropteroyltriglutamate--homocysteine S-methyltransferase [Tenacibaculum maritimum]SFZ83754.1 5-methyltetrahydropteroyltriglutamate--homocysteine methyltransferase (methionine synthase, vitamin-B12 independent isozyme; cobalamin-independent methionine synthase) [Tenacibaculum maritimum NCIMB 2154]
MKTYILGFPRIGKKRELKKALESYWKGQTTTEALLATAKQIRKENWLLQQKNGIDFIPSNDFSLYDQMLDTCLMLGCIPDRFEGIKKNKSELDLYFAMARGYQSKEEDVIAMEITKWFNTNYHYIVPEFKKNQTFNFFSKKVISAYKEAKELGIETKPTLIGPLTFLHLGKSKEANFDKISLLDNLLSTYLSVINELTKEGASIIQFDEPCLALSITTEERQALKKIYTTIAQAFPSLKIALASYFNHYGENLEAVLNLPVSIIHLDLIEAPSLLEDILKKKPLSNKVIFSLGLIDGRNVWKNNFEDSLSFIETAKKQLPLENIWISTSCSLLHSPYDLDLERENNHISTDIMKWLAFAKQKIVELSNLKKIVLNNDTALLEENKQAHIEKKNSTKIHNLEVKERIKAPFYIERKSSFPSRKKLQRASLKLPLFPTTTIGSFPQTKSVRKWRAEYRKQLLSKEKYETLLKNEIKKAISFQEKIDLDVLVHGEFERNDMVEYFGEQLNGFTFTNFGWVQSYGSRCVKPPIIFGDVSRSKPMTVKWTEFAQSLTKKPVKGMLTGPVTILQWSFVRNDQSLHTTCKQIALAIRDEVIDLEKAGIKVIQIDEPAIREGLPLKKADWNTYLKWAIECFKIAASGVQDSTQIHTHMCYSEFNDIIEHIANMDADVITIETSRSHMELLDAFVKFKYPNEIGPGVYDIHSPRVPCSTEIETLLHKALEVLPHENVWVNPDCGLKTRSWTETELALKELVKVSKKLRNTITCTAK